MSADGPGQRVGSAVIAEFSGTALLLAIVVGSGIMGERLASGNPGITLLANSLATGAGLTVLILALAPVSGAHFNPLVSCLAALRREQSWRITALYVLAQFAGALVGVMLAHTMFDETLVQVSGHARSGPGQMLSEFVATAGLLGAIVLCSGRGSNVVAPAVGLYIMAAYWFTASTSFANPAVTVARTLTDSFAGIAPGSAPGFIAAQCLALAFVALVFVGAALAASRASTKRGRA